ncbi:hypothetical protein HYZ05_03380 [Candidatus Daviesbacteria bacterium]|nr:hypothetical protein [Candidatus Daviesbacteria bacterium]
MGQGHVESPSYPIEIPFQGSRDNKPYIWEVHNSGATRTGFLGIPECRELVENIVPGLYLKTYPYRDQAMASARVTMTLSHPRSILMLARYEDEYVGYGVFPRLVIRGDSVVYSSRAFTAAHEGQGLGTNALDQVIKIHNDELRRLHQKPLAYGALYTGSPVSLASIVRSENTDNVRPLFRREGLKGGGRYVMLSGPQRVVKEIHSLFLPNTTSLNNLTGVCRGELRDIGPNQSYIPGRSVLADQIYGEMISTYPDGLDMNIPQGDVVIVVYDIKAGDPVVSRVAA